MGTWDQKRDKSRGARMNGSMGIHRRTRYGRPQTRYDRSATTLPTLKADDGAVSPDPCTSPAIGRSHKRDEASSVRNKTERACEKVVCHTMFHCVKLNLYIKDL